MIRPKIWERDPKGPKIWERDPKGERGVSLPQYGAIRFMFLEQPSQLCHVHVIFVSAVV